MSGAQLKLVRNLMETSVQKWPMAGLWKIAETCDEAPFQNVPSCQSLWVHKPLRNCNRNSVYNSSDSHWRMRMGKGPALRQSRSQSPLTRGKLCLNVQKEPFERPINSVRSVQCTQKKGTRLAYVRWQFGRKQTGLAAKQSAFCLLPKAKLVKHSLLFAATGTSVCTTMLVITFEQQGPFGFKQLTTAKKLLLKGGVKI